jgi:CheY-like chemotaxis protein
LILLDLNMPILDGSGFLAERLSDPRLAKVPVVVMSGIDWNRSPSPASRGERSFAKTIRATDYASHD